MHHDMKEISAICPVCNSSNASPTLAGRPDYEFGLTFESKYWKCRNSNCELVFVSPKPTPDEISGFYGVYSTHVSNQEIKVISMATRISRFLYLKNITALFDKTSLNKVKVLDYGCGNGNLLQDLSAIGIKDIMGYDMDPVACSFAAKQGLKVFSEIDKVKTNGPYDYIFLNHVIEHLMDPENDIIDMMSNLNPNGRLIIRTPNSTSFLSTIFGESWRGWEVPRHLHIFNVKNIRLLINKMNNTSIISLKTSNLMFSGIFNESFHSDFSRKTIIGKVFRKILFYVFLIISSILKLFFNSLGEELSMVITLKNKNN
jgi:2-polyprenyl-3-methyl-5-hydroxy-6-metoxy-1,4-benzoquinol methylase